MHRITLMGLNSSSQATRGKNNKLLNVRQNYGPLLFRVSLVDLGPLCSIVLAARSIGAGETQVGNFIAERVQGKAGSERFRSGGEGTTSVGKLVRCDTEGWESWTGGYPAENRAPVHPGFCQDSAPDVHHTPQVCVGLVSTRQTWADCLAAASLGRPCWSLLHLKSPWLLVFYCEAFRNVVHMKNSAYMCVLNGD